MNTKLKYGLGLLAIFGLALALRVYFSYPHVLQNGWVSYQETDCYHNMRIITLLAQHFPHMPSFDPYGFYPAGMSISSPPFFYYLFAFVAWVIGLGSPSQHLVEMVGAWLPAILGALVTIPVFFIGKELFGKQAGLLAAAIIAIIPGQLLWRSTLGFPDYHILEVLLSTTCLAFLIMAFNRSGKYMAAYSALAGIILGLYLLSWTGSVLFVMIIFIALVLQSVVNHLRGRSNTQLCTVGVTMFALANAMTLVIGGYGIQSMTFLSLTVGIVVFILAWIFSTIGKKAPKSAYPIVLVLLGIGIAGLLSLIERHTIGGNSTTLLMDVLDSLGRFKSVSGMLTVAEAKGITLPTVWDYFTSCFYIGLATLPFIAYQAIKDSNASKLLLVVWSAVILVSTFQQNRFAYYLAVPIALLTAYIGAKVIAYGSSIVPKGKEDRAVIRRKGKKRKNKKEVKRRKFNPQLAYSLLSILVVGLIVFLPNVLAAVDRVKADTGMGTDWHAALVWLHDNTPEPLANSTYVEIVPADYTYPDSSYGVMSWWDYGYFITYVAHRIPNANPGGMGYVDAGLFFTSQSEEEANAILDRLGTKYVIIDEAMATGKFYAMAEWAGKDSNDYVTGYYYSDQSGVYQPVGLFTVAYYQSMCARLYGLEGQVSIPSQIMAISWSYKELGGHTAKVITDVKNFDTYDAAKEFLKTNSGYMIVGQDPFASPVPLEKLGHYKLIHSTASVKVFEYTPY